MSTILKICKKHGELTKEDLKTGVYKGKKYRKCKKCESERVKEYYKKIYADTEKHAKLKQKDKDYWSKNKDSIKKRRVENDDPGKRREQYKKYAPRYREKCNEKQKEYRETLSDVYMRKIIQCGNKNIPLMSIPQSMIKLKRTIMLAKKSIKNLNEINLKRRSER